MLAVTTVFTLKPLPASLRLEKTDTRKPRVLDRNGIPLAVTYQNRWNLHDSLPLFEVPQILKKAFIYSEDKRFYSHKGVDWLARTHALLQNLAAFKAVRGASTITEQVVRMINPRPRTLWSRWLEGIEGNLLEKRFSKEDILEFYLNQVPYAANRRGVAQAARYYFNRHIDTLSIREMLALVVLVRAPGRMDLYRDRHKIEPSLRRLAAGLYEENIITGADYESILDESFKLEPSRLPVQASHFIQHIYKNPKFADRSRRILSTLDSSLQKRSQAILDQRLKDLGSRNVTDGAILVVDHQTGEVLAWVNGGGFSSQLPGSQIDAVLTPRQPGSTLKPFLYALAIESGWTPATLIDDSPLSSSVGSGLHSYHNYSRQHYGPLRLREALGNSLNIPAIKAVRFTGVNRFFGRLHELGFSSLTEHPDYYGEGLALGNGEITLYELVQAYSALAGKGRFRPLRVTLDYPGGKEEQRKVFTPPVVSLIGNILSDPDARRLEFGEGNLLRFPLETAVKTGTSSDYRDAWAVGFSDRHTVGVWMGNLDQSSMQDITGSVGPAVVLRAVFAELNRHRESKPLYLSPKLSKVKICRVSGKIAHSSCNAIDEWFLPENKPKEVCSSHDASHAQEIKKEEDYDNKLADVKVSQPVDGLYMAMDPRIPDGLEAFLFKLDDNIKADRVEWIVNKEIVGITKDDKKEFLWRMSRGRHRMFAKVWLPERKEPVETKPVTFNVK